MQNLKILNSKEEKRIYDALKLQFGYKKKIEGTFLKNSKDRLFLISSGLQALKLDKLRINSMGLYFGELQNKQVRLSIEGSQLVAKDANQGILSIEKDKMDQWLKGFDFDTKDHEDGYYIVKCCNEVLGCARISQDRVLNFVPKNRRLRATF